MNYRHAFHAGNHADVLKHCVLALCLNYLNRKDKAWRYIDTHAGIGLYDLTSSEAQRSPEWRDGIARLWDKPLSDEVEELLRPYRHSVQVTNDGDELQTYPGSPAVARAIARKQDRLTLVELHPADSETLATHYAGDHQVKCIELDGWLALGSFVPPKERRGLCLVDPPFEQPGEFDRLVSGLAKAHARWREGIYLLWYPIKDVKSVDTFYNALRDWRGAPTLQISLNVRPAKGETFDGSGLICVNPPYMLHNQLETVLPALTKRLAQDSGASFELSWLTSEEELA